MLRGLDSDIPSIFQRTLRVPVNTIYLTVSQMGKDVNAKGEIKPLTI